MTIPILITLMIFYSNIVIGLISGVFLLRKLSFQKKIDVYQQRVDSFKKRLKLIFLNVLLLTALTVISLEIGGGYFTFKLPTSLMLAVVQFFIYLIIDDVWFYFFHRYMHQNKFLLRKIHRIHHKANHPLPLEFIYVHPLEWVVGSFSIVVACALIYYLFGTINFYPFWAFAFFRGLHELCIHSGTPSKILKYLPFFLPNEAHEMHHSRASGNYASMLKYLDIFFKTKIQR